MKASLRKQMVEKKRRLSPRDKDQASRTVSWVVCRLPQWKQAQIISVYRALPTEVDTKEIIERARLEGKTILFPDSQKTADLYIVPGLAFDRQGNRLGRGKGYYDRLLSGVTAPKIGLAFDVQLVAEVPHTLYDVPMDLVVTERGVYGTTKTS